MGEDGEAVEQFVPRNGGCPFPINIQVQVGWGSEQPDLVEMSLLIAGDWTR